MLQSWLELNRTDRRRTADVENVDCSRLDSRGVHDRSHLLSEVVHVAVAFSGDRNLLLIAHELGRPRRNPKYTRPLPCQRICRAATNVG